MRLRNPELRDVHSVGSNMIEAHHGLLHILFSYKTPVAILAPSGLYKTEKHHSRTTSGHIAKWFRSWNLDPKGATEITQEGLESAAERGIDPKNLADEAFTSLRNPRSRHKEFGSHDVGCHIDGAFGEKHAIGRMYNLLINLGGVDKNADRLIKEFDDWLEEDWEWADEWLHDATEVLQRNTADGYVWEWDAGNLCLLKENGRRVNPRPRRTRRRMGLIKDMRFFREQSGGIVGEGSRRGLDLARAEREMKRRGWVVTWEPDNDADWSWMSEEEQKREHEVYVAILWNTDPERSHRPGHMNATVLASLGGIFDPDQKYMRVIEAELASEALSGR